MADDPDRTLWICPDCDAVRPDQDHDDDCEWPEKSGTSSV